MGEVFCTAAWDHKLLKWLEKIPDRYVVCLGDCSATSHPRLFSIEPHDLAMQQIVDHLLFLPFTYEDRTHPDLQRLERVQTEAHFRASDFLDQGQTLLANYRQNLQTPFSLAKECFGKMEGVSAVICGAGPSLKEAIPFLKQHRDHLLILGCGAGVEALLAAGVRPHAAVHVDAAPLHRFSKTDIPLFFQLRTSHQVVSQMQGPRFLMAGAGTFPLEAWIEEKLGLESPSDGGWTATTRGMSLATHFGCNRVALVGMDFSGSYAEGVKLKHEGQRADWRLAGSWVNDWVKSHPDIAWGVKKNPLMPDVPELCLEPGKRVVFPETIAQTGIEVWQEMASDLQSAKELADQFLSRMQAIFPHRPSSDPTCQEILHRLQSQIMVQTALDPIWNYWEEVLKRAPENHTDALTLHRILLLKSIYAS